MKVLVKSAKILDPASSYHQKTVDIYINHGRIEKIGDALKLRNIDREINLEDLHVSRGWFDSSVSFGEPGFEERETIVNGLDTAALSGFTAVGLNSNTNPVIDDNGAVTSVLSKAKDHPVRLYPIGALTRKAQGKDLAELYDMKQAGAVAFGDYKKSIKNANLLKLALQYVQSFGGLIQSFPQNSEIAGKGVVNEDVHSTHLGLSGIPSLAEELQIIRDLTLLEYTGGRLHIPTISTGRSVHLVKQAKKKGLDVTCSVAVHNLVFSDEILHDFNTNAKVLPPLRNKQDIKSLIKGIKDGTIDMVTSDHNPIDVEHKKVEFEHALYGTTGLETSFGGLLTMTDVHTSIALLTRGRTRFGIEEPEIEEGSHADLSLFTPTGKKLFSIQDISSTSKNSLFLEKELKGKVYGIISGNQQTLRD